MDKTCLDIGGGDEPYGHGFLNVDAYAEEADIKAPMDNLPFTDCTVDEIRSSHVLEHIGKYEVVPTLKEWYRVLRFGGLLIIEVPDLEWVLKNWLSKRGNGWDMDAIFGDQSSLGQFHKTGFDRNIMYNYLLASGFDGCEVKSTKVWSHSQDSLVFETEKT